MALISLTPPLSLIIVPEWFVWWEVCGYTVAAFRICSKLEATYLCGYQLVISTWKYLLSEIRSLRVSPNIEPNTLNIKLQIGQELALFSKNFSALEIRKKFQKWFCLISIKKKCPKISVAGVLATDGLVS